MAAILHSLYDKIPFYAPMEIRLPRSDSFLSIRETLTRIGVGAFSTKTLWQTCHILHFKGQYFILHFLEMMMIKGEQTKISPEDLMRRNSVGSLLQQWGLCTLISHLGQCSDQKLRIIPYKEKEQWTLLSKYTAS